MPNPSVSIVIPAYGRPDYLRGALASALAQTAPADEIVVIDDGSPVSLQHVAQEFAGVHYVHKVHSGIAASRNRGIAESQSEYILWLDSDDKLLPGTLKQFHKIIARFPDADVIYGDLIVADGDLKPLRLLRHNDWLNRNRELMSLMPFGNPIPNPGTLVRRDLYSRFGAYDETFSRSEDYEFWSRIAVHARFKHCGGTTLLWRWQERLPGNGALEAEKAHDARVVERLIERNELSNLFPDLSWSENSRADSETKARLRLAERLLQLGAQRSVIGQLRFAQAIQPSEVIESLIHQLDALASVTARPQPVPVSIETGDPLKILILAQSFPPYSYAGTELYARDLTAELIRQGHRAEALYLVRDNSRPPLDLRRLTSEGLPLAELNLVPFPDPYKQIWNDEIAAAVAHYVASGHFDVAHFQHLIGFTPAAMKAVKLSGIATALTLHDTWALCEQVHLIRPDHSYCAAGPESARKCAECLMARSGNSDAAQLPLYQRLLELRRNAVESAFSSTDLLISPTKFIEDSLARHGFHHPNLLLLPLGLRPLPRLSKLPQNGKLRLLFLGNIFPTKGLDLLISALGGCDPSLYELNVFGRIADLDHFRYCMSLTPPGADITYRGAYSPDKLPEIFANADLTILPSRAENYPTTARESLAAGVPVVAPRVGGIPEIISDAINGHLFKLGDVDDLTAVLAELLQSPSSIDRLAANCRPPLSIEDDAAQLVKHYRTLLKVRSTSVNFSPAGKSLITA